MRVIYLLACVLLISVVLSILLVPRNEPATQFVSVASSVSTPVIGVHKVICLGDSITQFGERPGGYVWLLRQYLDTAYPLQHIQVINAGVAGNTSEDMLKRFDHDVLSQRPDVVTINVGINDVTRGFNGRFDGRNPIPLDSFRRNVDRMVCDAQARHIRVVLVSPTIVREDLDNPLNVKVSEYDTALRDIACQRRATYIDCRSAFQKMIRGYQSITGTNDDFLTVDGVHPNLEGNQIMAHCILIGLGVTPRIQKEAQVKVMQMERIALGRPGNPRQIIR